MCLDSSVGRAPARLAVGPRFDFSFGHFLLLRSFVIRSRCWTLTAMRLFHPSHRAAKKHYTDGLAMAQICLPASHQSIKKRVVKMTQLHGKLAENYCFRAWYSRMFHRSSLHLLKRSNKY